MTNGVPRPLTSATKSEVALIAADTVLALKSIQLALMAIRRNDDRLLDDQIQDIERHSESLWARFKEMSGE